MTSKSPDGIGLCSALLIDFLKKTFPKYVHIYIILKNTDILVFNLTTGV